MLYSLGSKNIIIIIIIIINLNFSDLKNRFLVYTIVILTYINRLKLTFITLS
jgi:hypothetical protein